MKATTWQAWNDGDDGVVFAPASRCLELVLEGLLPKDAKLLHEISARTGEEAMTFHYQRMGFEAYRPSGAPQACPNQCGGNYYPEGYGDCPNCGHIG